MTRRLLGMSRSGYDAWRRSLGSERRRQSRRLAAEIRAIHEENAEVYGSLACTRSSGREATAPVVVPGGSADTARGDQVPPGTAVPAHDGLLAPVAYRGEPSEPVLRGKAAQGDVGRGHHLRPDSGGVAVPGVARRSVLEDDRGLSCAGSDEPQARHRGVGDGPWASPAPRAVAGHPDRGSRYASRRCQGLPARHGVRIDMSRKGDRRDDDIMETAFGLFEGERFTSRSSRPVHLRLCRGIPQPSAETFVAGLNAELARTRLCGLGVKTLFFAPTGRGKTAAWSRLTVRSATGCRSGRSSTRCGRGSRSPRGGDGSGRRCGLMARWAVARRCQEPSCQRPRASHRSVRRQCL